MKLLHIHKLLFLLLLTSVLVACKTTLSNPKMKEKLKKLTSVRYHFGDSSVPPPFHRSYSIVADKDSILLTVNSYGEILATKNYPMPEGGLQKIAASIIKNKISKAKEKKDKKGCTGGTTKTISYSCESDEDGFSASAYYCGNEVYGDLSGKVDSFLVDFKAFVPDLGEVIASTKN